MIKGLELSKTGVSMVDLDCETSYLNKKESLRKAGRPDVYIMKNGKPVVVK